MIAQRGETKWKWSGRQIKDDEKFGKFKQK